MSLNRHATRRDAVEEELVAYARALGWNLWALNEPCDLLGLHSGRWHAIEVKDPKKQGWASEFKPAQIEFILQAEKASGKVLIWRRTSDIDRDTTAAKRGTGVTA